MGKGVNRLRRLREEKDLTQEELAYKAGVSFFTISRLENGHNPNPTKRVRMALAAALDTEPDILFPRAKRVAS